MPPISPNITLRVQRIQRFSLHDGPGIRTTVFTQGCPLRCWWCHNPETLEQTNPNATGWAIRALAHEASKDQAFFERSGGGVTLCGGEPLMQIRAVVTLLTELGQRGIHRTLDTSGHVPLSAVEQAAPLADHWLWDIKHVDPARFKDGTRGSIRPPMDNLRWLLEHTDAPVWVRVPVIPGFNDDDASIAAIGGFLGSLPRPVEVEPLRGHDVGRDREAARARSAILDTDPFNRANQTFHDLGLPLRGVH